jgi:catechol 2,3-dioxygenase-like lactoylglutathione lyase family enzyme
MEVKRIDHFTIRTIDLEATRGFYEASLGLSTGWRPNFPFPGYWLYNASNAQALIHLAAPSVVERAGLADRSGGLVDYLGSRSGEGSGALDHIAMRGVDAPSYLRRLKLATIPYRMRVVPELNELQIFVVDPNEITIEVIFASSEVDSEAMTAPCVS